MKWEHIELFERWRQVVGYEGLYEVSDWGRVRSLGRERMPGKGNYARAGKLLNPQKNHLGYSCVNLRKNGKVTHLAVHTLVAKAFLGPYPLGKEVDHIDGDGTNNVLLNLRYVTHKENLNAGNFARNSVYGEKCGTAKLNNAQVSEIRRLTLEGMTRAAIAREFGVTSTAIRDIILGRTWRK